jgi:hypothetical protein
VHDPHVPSPTASFEQAVDSADAVVVAADHSEFRDPRTLAAISALAADGCLVVDPWNCWGSGQVFAYTAELAPVEDPRSGAGQEVPPPSPDGRTDSRGRSQSNTSRLS